MCICQSWSIYKEPLSYSLANKLGAVIPAEPASRVRGTLRIHLADSIVDIIDVQIASLVSTSNAAITVHSIGDPSHRLRSVAGSQVVSVTCKSLSLPKTIALRYDSTDRPNREGC